MLRWESTGTSADQIMTMIVINIWSKLNLAQDTTNSTRHGYVSTTKAKYLRTSILNIKNVQEQKEQRELTTFY